MVQVKSLAEARGETAAVGSSTGFAEEALRLAMDYCRKQAGADEDWLASFTKNQAQIHDYFHYAIAEHVGQYVGMLDTTVKAVYVCNWEDQAEEDLEAVPSVTTPVGLLVWTSNKTAALESLLDETSSSLTERYREILSPRADKLRNLINAHIVDDKDVDDRSGYAVLINSLYHPATKVWER